MKLKEKIELCMIENMGLINGLSQIGVVLTTGQIYEGLGTHLLTSCYQPLVYLSSEILETIKPAFNYKNFVRF